MKILSVHNRYLQRGGEDASREAEEQLLLDHGHDVIRFEADNREIKTLGTWRTALRTVWSGPAYAAISDLIRRQHPDVMHVQNFFPLLSPSVYYAARRLNVPVVQSLRNYRTICSNSQFLRDQRPCEDCLGKTIPWPGVLHRCYRQSRAGSAVVCAMLSLHNLRRTWHNQVTLNIALTRFARDKFIQAGWDPERVIVKPNFLLHDPGQGTGERCGVLFVGRLSPEKGLQTLISAWSKWCPDEPLRIVGDGSGRSQVEKWAKSMPTVEYMGERSGDEVLAYMKTAKLLIFPSIWYETFGRTIMEAFATGTAVVASRIGAPAELVEEGKTGWHFAPGDPADLVRVLHSALSDPAQWQAAGQRARKTYEALYTATSNYESLMRIYSKAIKLQEEMRPKDIDPASGAK
jgi:glycosyltransferase involved in cell wall biosynthesis